MRDILFISIWRDYTLNKIIQRKLDLVKTILVSEITRISPDFFDNRLLKIGVMLSIN